MAKKPFPGNEGSDSDNESTSSFANAVKDSAQQIWLAGLGALSKAQEEGGKVFDALVKEGVSIQKRTQAVAEETLGEASTRMADMASDLSNKASGQWDRMEGLVEERVARTLKRLGVPTARDIDALVERIEELNRTVAALQANAGNGGRARARAARAATQRAPARKVGAKAAPRKHSVRKAAG